MNGVLALVGGGEWRDGCEELDRGLLEIARDQQVVVLPTGAAYEQPDAVVDGATTWFAELGARVRPVMALDRAGANDARNAAAVRQARLVYLAGGSALHLRSVLMRSALWESLETAWQSGATIAGTSAGAMVLCDPMVDPRGGAFTVGLGMLSGLAVIPHVDTWSDDKLQRTLRLSPPELPVVGIAEQAALLLGAGPDGTGSTWRTGGTADVRVWVGGEPATLDDLPAPR